MDLTNKHGQLISLPDALTFAWHFGMPSDWSKADVINDPYTKSARNYSNNFGYLR